MAVEFIGLLMVEISISVSNLNIHTTERKKAMNIHFLPPPPSPPLFLRLLSLLLECAGDD